jgi:hypothetical protein
MGTRARLAGIALLATMSLLAVDGAALAASGGGATGDHDGRRARFATFNASLNRAAEGQLIANLSTPNDPQAQNAAETIQRVRPDVLLINEFDFDAAGQAARLFQRNYLSVGHNGAAPIHYPFRFVAPSNTGIPSGFDLDNNGSVGGPNDAFGFGAYPGQFGMAVFSRFPILRRHVRTFQLFLWKDMPGARLPDDPATPAPADWYSPEELAVFRLSSKSHWDLPVLIGGKEVHALVSHPTPPVFDGPEDRNGTRNFDEIRLWADYVVPSRSRYLYDDQGGRGGLRRGASFVIMGDQNSDPFDGDQPRRSRAGRAPGRCQPDPPWRPGVRHRRLRRHARPGQPAGRLRPAQQEPAHAGGPRLLAAPHRPAVPPGRGVPVPHLRPPPGVGRRARRGPPGEPVITALQYDGELDPVR